MLGWPILQLLCMLSKRPQVAHSCVLKKKKRYYLHICRHSCGDFPLLSHTTQPYSFLLKYPNPSAGKICSANSLHCKCYLCMPWQIYKSYKLYVIYQPSVAIPIGLVLAIETIFKWLIVRGVFEIILSTFTISFHAFLYSVVYSVFMLKPFQQEFCNMIFARWYIYV